MKDQLSLPSGDRGKGLTNKGEIALPNGDRDNRPALRPQLSLPTTRPLGTLAEGIGGLNDAISPTVRPFNALSVATNLTRVDVTAAETRPGRVTVGDARPSTGLQLTGFASFNYRFLAAGTPHLIPTLFVGSGTNWWQSQNDGTWVLLKSGVSAKPFTAATINGKLVICNGYDAPYIWDGSGAGIGLLGGDPPKGRFCLSAYRRLFVTGVPGDNLSLYASDPADPEVWPTTYSVDTGALETGDSATVTCGVDDGDEIVGICLFRQRIVVFKRWSLYELHGPEVGQPSRFWQTMHVQGPGPVNHNAVVELNGTLYWLSPDGIMAWTGGTPQVISQSVQGVIDGISWNAANTTANAGTDGERIFFSLPMGSDTQPTVTLVLDTRDNSWWKWTDWSPVRWVRHSPYGYNMETYLLDWNGTVYRIEGTTDAGTAIQYEAVFGPTMLGSLTREKILRRAYVVGSVATGATLNFSTALSESGAYGTAATLTGTAETSRVKKSLPVNAGDPSEAYIARFRVNGSGVVTLHDFGLEYQERDV